MGRINEGDEVITGSRPPVPGRSYGTAALSSDRTSHETMLDSVLSHGTYLIVARFDGQEVLLDKTHALLKDGVEALEGVAARRVIETRGLGALHEALPAAGIGALRDFVMPKIRPDLFALACGIGRKLLGIDGEFFVDDYTILRINYPYVVALQAPANAENPGIGRVAERTRHESQGDRVVDPVYDPKSYHDNQPPPAWAHGAHKDTWTGHSRWGVNLWWALDDVAEECSMVFYPETFGRAFVPDPRSLYLKAGQPLPKPTRMALRRGEMLVFNPEMLHGTHLNTTGVTRLALSTRLNPRPPTFDPHCFYAREFWHSSVDIDAGRHEEVIRFRREEHLDANAEPAILEAPVEATPLASGATDGEWQTVGPADAVPPGRKVIVRREGVEDVLLLRGSRTLHAVQAQCPHLRVGLADGWHDDETISCPGHAVAFSLADGRSSCASLTLRTYDVREEHGTIWLRRA